MFRHIWYLLRLVQRRPDLKIKFYGPEETLDKQDASVTTGELGLAGQDPTGHLGLEALTVYDCLPHLQNGKTRIVPATLFEIEQ